MEMRQLEYFLEITKQKSFTKAAEQLLFAQPAISKGIKSLEKELGLQLFHRSDKKITLTDEGDVFLKHAKAILSQVNNAKLEMAELRGLEKGVVNIGLPSMAGSYFFPKIIVDFKRIYPHIDISIFEAGTKQIQAMIEQGKIDMGAVVLDDTNNNLETVPFLEEEMVVCLPKEHPLAHQPFISYEQLAQEPLVLFKEGYFQRDIITEVSKRTGLTPNITFETNQISLTKSLTRRGLGVTLFLKMVIEEDEDLVPVSIDPPYYLTLALAWKKNAYLSKANQVFIDFLMEQTHL
ncbi:LysR family transcriptional regulator [Texcoconibacillus texcoconensis]|uniref:DNA-binding transcriptional LysR family regulator n=1 Tax=Texcoconibacillus texcoconensis TaxID=1095777 RepID=A0A840QLU3_9BACI|nr:LysR family transcriptional regulator [Texcoconibacillus texcoconensis]MBB5172310.1 DNA-binding transcriptional LysR family regulator [Texcoconibacillus texcoconensis]